jgi:hypothetical protein
MRLVAVKSSVIWDVKPCSLVVHRVSEEHTTSIFKSKSKPRNQGEASIVANGRIILKRFLEKLRVKI